jgi:transcriptional regulator with XRE-family HTH domain
VGEQLKILLEILGLKQNQFAKSVDVSPSHVSDILTGRRNGFSTEVIIKISELYNVNIHWLLTGEGEMFLTSPPSPLLKERGEESSKVMQSDAPEPDENDMSKPTSQKKQNGLSGVNGSAEIFEGEINHVRWFMELPRDTQTLILAAAELEDMDVIKQGRDFFLFAVQMQRTKKQMLEAGSELALRKKGEAG